MAALTSSATPPLETTVLPVPVTEIVPPPSAEKPVPVVVEMSRPLPPPAGVKLIVPPALLVSSVTALFAPVVSAIVGLLKLIVPPLLLATRIPVPVEVIEPVWNVTVPASWLSMSTANPVLSVMLPL